ncbi:hypothetical protein AAG570_013896 [Ranatra chinensis]|uniref:Methyltransferase-like protein 22 n=1 Tax=Ranatra chinensis TaxID=642074 RepID=A0ABD0YE67_9HEMI
MVGLQLWRGAFVLADFILENGPSMFTSKNVLELGSGVGLTSIVASFFAQKMVSTDVPAEGILELIDRNFKRNSGFVKSSYRVMPFDFFDQEWSEELCSIVSETDIVLAADVVYDDSLTEAFVETLTKILSTEKKKTIFVALEKRYVFTVADLDTVAPCYEYFLECIRRVWNKPPMSQWGMKSLSINFARYFIYKRNSDIVLWQITN